MGSSKHSMDDRTVSSGLKAKPFSTWSEFYSSCEILYPPYGHNLPRVLVGDKVVGNCH